MVQFTPRNWALTVFISLGQYLPPLVYDLTSCCYLYFPFPFPSVHIISCSFILLPVPMFEIVVWIMMLGRATGFFFACSGILLVGIVGLIQIFKSVGLHVNFFPLYMNCVFFRAASSFSKKIFRVSNIHRGFNPARLPVSIVASNGIARL